ncbi:MAG: hypothetical protein EOM12_13450 [Verrucomicrobiae bacterium]|nr:hypothetical protein [Verrucomicrobiae bacterium]
MTQVIRKQVVARALSRLREQKTHTLFPGYLYLQQRSAQLNRLEDLQPDFAAFFGQYLHVKNNPLGTPYIKLFTEQKASPMNLWLNENVAGSYAPSSLRSGHPFRKVVKITGRKYSLPVNHAQLAFEHLLYSNPVQVADLSAVLYRDYGLNDDVVSIRDVIDVFIYEFGYSNAHGSEPNENFELLYSFGTAQDWEEDWLEII